MIISEQPNNFHLSDKIETVQYNVALVITGAISGTSKEKYWELGLESLKDRRSLRPMSYLYFRKITLLFVWINSPLQRSHWYPGCFQTLCCRTTVFQNSFLSTITVLIELESDINNIDSHAMCLKKIFTFIRPLENDSYGIYDPLCVRLLDRLCLGFSHLREHKFRHNFVDTLNLLCSCCLETEDTEHYFLCCQNNLSLCTTLMNDLNNVNTALACLNPKDLLRVIFYGDKNF